MSRRVPLPTRVAVSSSQQHAQPPLPAHQPIGLDLQRRILFARRLAILLRRVLLAPRPVEQEEPRDDA